LDNSPLTRTQVIESTQRIVVKVGSRLLTDTHGEPSQARIAQLIDEIHRLRQSGVEVILVTSGAIGLALQLLEEEKRPRDLSQLQALAAVGQSRLMAHYEAACQTHGFHCGQMLLIRDDLSERKRHLNICNCLNALLARNILPIINENDTVSVDEIAFGDNDTLAALVAAMVRADLTILLTSVDGLMKREGDVFTDRISTVSTLDDEIRSYASGTDGNIFSTGGMLSKIRAAEICMAAGESLWIADGRDFTVLQRVIASEDVGTLFVPGASRMSSSRRWLAFFTEPCGTVKVDSGAVRALRKTGCSLLPSGIIAVDGEFEKGDTLRIVGDDDEAVGMGVSNYDAADMSSIKGLQSSQIYDTLGHSGYGVVIHRDTMVVWDETVVQPE
jgi:glutamate 5-kinase